MVHLAIFSKHLLSVFTLSNVLSALKEIKETRIPF